MMDAKGWQRLDLHKTGQLAQLGLKCTPLYLLALSPSLSPSAGKWNAWVVGFPAKIVNRNSSHKEAIDHVDPLLLLLDMKLWFEPSIVDKTIVWGFAVPPRLGYCPPSIQGSMSFIGSCSFQDRAGLKGARVLVIDHGARAKSCNAVLACELWGAMRDAKLELIPSTQRKV